MFHSLCSFESLLQLLLFVDGGYSAISEETAGRGEAASQLHLE